MPLLNYIHGMHVCCGQMRIRGPGPYPARGEVSVYPPFV